MENSDKLNPCQRHLVLKRIGELISPLFALVVLLSWMHLSPGLGHLFEQSETLVLGDGTDSLTLPFSYSVLKSTAQESPLIFFTGALPTVQRNAPVGDAIWMAWIEKFSLTVFCPIVLELGAGAYVVCMVSFSYSTLCVCTPLRGASVGHGGCAFSLGLRLTRRAFNPYTRGRAKVLCFGWFVFPPLVFLGFEKSSNVGSGRLGQAYKPRAYFFWLPWLRTTTFSIWSGSLTVVLFLIYLGFADGSAADWQRRI